jgi:hypothetical protein
MVSTISFIQANLQHSIAASSILTRTVGVKGVDVALIQEPWYHKGCVSGLSIPGYTLYSVGGKTTGTYPGKEHEHMDAAGILLQGPGGSLGKV